MIEDPVARRLIGLLRVEGPPSGAPDASEWDAIVRLAGRIGVLGLLAARADAQGFDVPAPASTQLALARTRIGRQHGLHAIEAARAQRALDAVGVFSVALKGVVLASLVYESPAERAYRDIDLLVAEENLPEALATLAGLGLREECPEAVRRAYRAHHFHAVLGGEGRPFVELHWGVTRPDDPYSLESADLLANPVEVGELRAPHPDAHVLLAVVSLMRDGFSQLRPVLDLDRILRSGLAIRWDRVARLAAAGGLGAALRAALELSRELFGTPVGDQLTGLPSLGAAERRLRALRLDSLPFEAHAERATLRARLVQLQLVAARGRWAGNFLLRKRFERAQLRASGVPAHRRALGFAKRSVQLARMGAWQLAH